MKVRHYFAALLLAFGLGQQAYAEEQKKSEAPQEAPAAATSRDTSADAAPGQDTAVLQPDASLTPAAALSKHVPAAHGVNTAEQVEPAPALHADRAASWRESFLYEVKITDVLIALFAGLLVVLGWVQARRMREAVGVAQESASVAEKSARVAEDALISGQRAFMFIREIKTYLHQDAATGKYQWSIHPIWANSGNTPTKGLSINTTYRILDEPLPKDYDFPQSREDLIPTIAGPKSMVDAVPGTIDSEDLEAVQKGTKYFYIWGWAEYHDIFEGTKKHVTRFCNQLTHVDGDTTLPLSEHNPIQMMFGFHAENNYAD